MAWLDGQVVPAVDGVAYGLVLFVAAAGLTLAFGVADVLNLAHGALFAVGAYAAATFSHGSWGGLGVALLVGLVAGAAGGGSLAVLAAPIIARGPLAVALLTVGVAFLAGDLLTTVFGANEVPVPVPSALDGTVTAFGHRYPAYRLYFIALAVALAVAGRAVIGRSRVGRLVRATVDDRDMVACLGVSPTVVRAGVMAAAGALAAGAGVLGGPILGAGPSTADRVMLLSLVVVVVGGLGSIPGALIAAVGVGEVQTLGVTLMPQAAAYLLPVAAGVALLVRSYRPTIAGARS